MRPGAKAKARQYFATIIGLDLNGWVLPLFIVGQESKARYSIQDINFTQSGLTFYSWIVT